MFFVLAKAISSDMVANDIITPEDEPIYTYGIQQFFTIMLNLISVALIAALFNQLLVAAILMLTFIPLRSFAGGFHASTPVRCYLLSLVAVMAQLVILPMVAGFEHQMTLFAIPALCLLFVLTPVEDANKPLSQDEKLAYQKKCRQLSLLYYFILFVLTWFGLYRCGSAVFICLYSVVILVIAGLFKNGRS